MTHLRKITIEELVRRNYSNSTRECYIRTINEFALYFDCPPDKLGLEHIRIYQAHLFSDKETVSQYSQSAPGSPAFLLFKDLASAMEYGGNAISKTSDQFA